MAAASMPIYVAWLSAENPANSSLAAKSAEIIERNIIAYQRQNHRAEAAASLAAGNKLMGAHGR